MLTRPRLLRDVVARLTIGGREVALGGLGARAVARGALDRLVRSVALGHVVAHRAVDADVRLVGELLRPGRAPHLVGQEPVEGRRRVGRSARRSRPPARARPARSPVPAHPRKRRRAPGPAAARQLRRALLRVMLVPVERVPDVTRQAGPRAPRPCPLGVERSRVRAHLEGAEHAVALRTVDLFVAARATLEVLPGGLTVTQQPERAGVVVAGAEPARRWPGRSPRGTRGRTPRCCGSWSTPRRVRTPPPGVGRGTPADGIPPSRGRRDSSRRTTPRGTWSTKRLRRPRAWDATP